MKIETNSLPFALPFHVGCLLCVVAYKHVFVVIKMRAYSIYVAAGFQTFDRFINRSTGL